jgi:hypothetical protein
MLPFTLGINNSVLDYSYADTVYQRAQSLGCKLFRFDVPWNYAKGSWAGLEITPGTRASCSPIQAVIAKINTYGMNAIIVVDGQIKATQPGTYPTTPTQFAATMAYLVTNCPGQIWELINEPDQYQWGNTQGAYVTTAISAADYVSAYQLCYIAMKAADPTCTVNAFAVANVDNGGGGYNFVQAAYTAGLTQASYDRKSVHTYPYPTDTAPTTGNIYLVTGLTAFAAMCATNGDTKPLDITEFGWQSTGDGTMTAPLQAAYVQTYLSQLATWGGASRVCIYQCADAGGYWGLTDGSYVPKQSYQAVIDLLPDSNRFALAGGSRKRVT